LLVHGLVLGSIDVLGLSLVGEGFAATRNGPSSAADEVELETGCRSDAVLAGLARGSLCLAPWESDVDRCLQGANVDMYMDLSSCTTFSGVEAISMLERKASDKIKPIDAEKLLEEAKQDPPKPEPPKPPELVQQQPQIQQQQQPPLPPPPPPPQRPQQVVETANKTDSKDPENARLLAEHSSIAEKQTVARGAVNEPMVAKSKPAELAPKQNPNEASVTKHEDRPPGMNRDAPDVPGTLSMRQPGVKLPTDVAQEQKIRGSTVGMKTPGALSTDGLNTKKGTSSFEQDKRERSEIPSGQGGAGGGAPDVPNLKPTQETLERIAGGGSVDHLDDVAEGDETALNAKGWVHASFFNRLKRQVAQNWNPGAATRRSDPTGAGFGSKARITEVRVALTKTGALAKIVVVSSSGIQELDDEAVRAFHAAAPFVNPPVQLANHDGLIVFGFGFYVEPQQTRTTWRVVRPM
jgi:TonB family protein